MRELILLAHVPTEAVNLGFLPAADRLGLRTVLLTDHPEAHRTRFSQAGPAPAEVVPCDVFNPMAVLEALTRRPLRPSAVFSNSDHLQASTALAAEYLGLPGKPWNAAYRAKNKAEMRRFQAEYGLAPVWHATVHDEATLRPVLVEAAFPLILKPREGVASLNVSLVQGPDALLERASALWAQHPGQALLLEAYLPGPLHTLETLGDGHRLKVLGGFEVKLSAPPHFIEVEAVWKPRLDPEVEAEVLSQIRALGVGFGACHTEFVLTKAGPRLVEINYRSIGDQREFLLQESLGIPYFERVLRLHLGEPLEALDLAPNVAMIRYFPSQTAGTLRWAPEAFEHTEASVRLAFQPLRRVGDPVVLTHSNKDYLGVLRGTGPSEAALAGAMDQFDRELVWEVTP